jgi:hypothetical protein
VFVKNGLGGVYDKEIYTYYTLCSFVLPRRKNYNLSVVPVRQTVFSTDYSVVAMPLGE